MFGVVPRLSVDSLLLEVVQPNFVGTGSLKLDGDSALFDLVGVQPEFARTCPFPGSFNLTPVAVSFFDTSEPDKPFLQLNATSEGDDIDVTGLFDLGGYPLKLVTGLFGLPDGNGRVKAELASRLESFDIAETYQTLSLTGSYQIDWRNESLAIDSLRGRLSGSPAAMALTLAGGSIVLPRSAIRFTVGSGTNVQYADNQINIGPGMTAILQDLEGVDFQSALTGH